MREFIDMIMLAESKEDFLIGGKTISKYVYNGSNKGGWHLPR
jgi:hypothetical protein